MARREYVGGATQTTLGAGLSAGATTITLADGTGWPTGGTGPFAVDVDYENSSYEKILCASRSGNTITIAAASDRGYDDTTDTAHNSGATIRHVITSVDLDEANAHINNVGAVKHTGAAIADDTIDSQHYVAGSIDNEHLAASGFNISKFTDGTSDRDTTGNAATATTATNATNVTLTDESSDTTCFPVFATAATGNQAPKTDASALTYNASTGALAATSFTGDLTGEATNLASDNNVKPQQAFSSAQVNPTSATPTDLTGASITVTSPRANMVYVFTGVFDVTIANATADTTFGGYLDVDGSEEELRALYRFDPTEMSGAASSRATVSVTWVVPVATAASHTFKLQVARLAGTADVLVRDESLLTLVHAYG